MRITVKLKLGLAFGVVIVLAGMTAWLGISNLAALNDTTQTIITVDVGRMRVAQELRPDLLTVANADIRRLSDKDTLGIAPERMTANSPATSKVADAIADGDLTADAHRRFALNLTSGNADHRDAEFEKM